MRVLVTGGAGAIGSHLVEALLARGDQVSVLDSFHDFYPRVQKERNLAGARVHAGFKALHEGDIRDVAFVRSVFEQERPESVFHLAARAGVRSSVEEPFEYADVNLRGTAAVACEAAEAGVKRLIFASSATVYGENAAVPWAEDGDTASQLSPYGATKRGGELYIHTIHRTRGLDVTSLRFFSVYGPRQRPDLVVSKFTNLLIAGRPIPVLGDGSQERDYTYVDDVVDGCLRACDRADGFQVYNLGRGQPTSLNTVIGLLEQELGIEAVRHVLPVHPADIPQTWASIDKARRELGYEPRTEFADGVREAVKWLRKENACASS